MCIRDRSRDFGQVRYEHYCDRSEVLEKLIELKREKFSRTNTFDILSVDWASNLLREMFKFQDDSFRGILSVLWANESMVGAHFGMISGDVMQYWFPVFDKRYAKYSPGLQLLSNTIRCACDEGIKRIDLSYGHSKFKEMFANEQETVQLGLVNFNPLAFQIAKQRYHLRYKLKSIPLKTQIKYFLRKVYPQYGSWHFK